MKVGRWTLNWLPCSCTLSALCISERERRTAGALQALVSRRSGLKNVRRLLQSLIRQPDYKMWQLTAGV